MSAMAGALNVVLEKAGDYRLGPEFAQPVPEDISRAAGVTRSGVWLWWAVCLSLAVIFNVSRTSRKRRPAK